MAESNPMRSVDRALDVLEILEEADGPLRLSEVARRSGLHLATTQRILAALRARGRVAYDGSGYAVGLVAVIGINAFTTTNRLVSEVRPVMQELSQSTGLAASLHMRLGFSRVIVDRVGSDESIRYSGSIGRKLPLHLGAAKVIAAYLPDDERRQFVQVTGPHERANGTFVSVDEFSDELAQIRNLGYAVASQERIPGRFSVGAAIQTEPSVWDAALVLGGRGITDYDKMIPQMAIDVREAAGEISARRLRPL